MITFLLDHSIQIIAVLVVLALGRNLSKEYMEKHGLDRKQFLSLLRQKLNGLESILLSKLVTSAALTFTISLISFRQIWLNDIFHVIFLTSLLFNRIEKYFRDLFA